MRVMLLAAGFGTRLRPLTDKLPKCLVSIKGRPLLDIWLEHLVAAGYGPFLLNTHYLSEQVEEYVISSSYRDIVQLVYEPVLLGTAGTLIHNLNFFEEQPGLLIHADNYCITDFNKFILAHNARPKECFLTMMTFRTEKPSTCGIAELDERGVVVNFHEKKDNPPGDLANGAIYALSVGFMKILQNEFVGASDFSTEIIPMMLGNIFSYEVDGVLIDIGTPEALASVNEGFGIS